MADRSHCPGELLQDKDRQKAQRVMNAMLQMHKWTSKAEKGVRTIMSGIVTPSDIAAEGVAQAIQLAGDELRLTTAPHDQLTRRDVSLRARWRNSAKGRDVTPADPKPSRDSEVASKAIGAELRRRAFT